MIEEIFKILKEKNLRIALAESCTGGLCAAKLVEVPGISAHLIGSQVVYSNQAKRDWLGIKIPDEPEWTESSDCASMLAFNIQHSNLICDIGLSVVGHLDERKYIHACCYSSKFGWRDSGTISLVNHNRVSLQQEAMNKTLSFFLEYLRDKYVSN